MSRSRKIHTDISTEIKLNRVSEFAALLYSWGIPHARDDCRLPKRNAEELRLLIFPGRPKTAADMTAAFAELISELLMGVDEDGYLFYPDDVFYKYQSYINVKNRRETPKLDDTKCHRDGNMNKITRAENSRDQQRSAEISKEAQGLPENSASPSPSLSPSLRKSPAKNAGPVDKSDDRKAKPDFEPLVKMAAELGGKDLVAAQKLCQWTLSMIRTLKNEPPERTAAVVRSCLDIVKQKLANGYEITSMWGLLTVIFDKERTKYMQGPENEAYKRMPVPESMREIMKRIGNA